MKGDLLVNSIFRPGIVALCLAMGVARGDDTVYRDGEVTLAEVNRNAFGQILKKPYTERYLQATGVKPEDWWSVDLRQACNMGFEDAAPDDNQGGWTDSGSTYDLHPFGPGFGKVMFYGVPFDVIDPSGNDGLTMITMRSGWKTGTHFPDTVQLPVGKTAGHLYFLHGASYAETLWGMGASRQYEVLFEDGTVETIPVICAGGHENIANWMWNPSSGNPLLQTETARPVPVEIGDDVRYLFILEWTNPHPAKTIGAIRVKTRNDGKWFTLVLLAISGSGQ